MSLNYESAIRERMQLAMQELQAEQEQDPAIRGARRNVESARNLLLQETDGSTHMARDPRWTSWDQTQRYSVQQQWGERIEQARQALVVAERVAQEAQSSWIRSRRQQKQEAERSAQNAEQEQAQRTYALEQEQAARDQHREAWLAAGGLPELFESAWPGMWQEELVKRSRISAPQAKLRATGRYIL